MESKTVQETEKCLKVPESSGDNVAEVAASVFDLTYDPNSKASKTAAKKLWPQPIQGWQSILASIAAASIHIPVGIVVGYSAILIPQLEAPDSEISVTKEETSWIASLAVLVVPVGALVTGFLMDHIGRLNTIKVACIPYIIGWLMIAIATNLPMILVGRFLTGFAIAMGPSSSIVYITEVSRPDLRGSLICLGPSMTSFGMLLVFIKGAVMHWRTVAWIGIAYCILPLLLMAVLAPESPVWLMSRGKTAKALKSLKYLSRGEVEAGLAERQLSELQKDNENKQGAFLESSVCNRFVTGFRKPTGYKPLIILLVLFFFQQFCGIYITIFYAVTFFQEVGSGFDAHISTILIGLIRMLVGLLTSFLLKRFGRRPLCIVSGLGMAATLFVSGYFTRKIQIGELESSIVPVICLLLYMTMSVTGLMTIPWTMTAELFPLGIRGLAQGLVVSLAHVIMFGALQVYRSLPDLLGGSFAVQWFFAVMSLLSAVFVLIFVPETHKKLLSDIQQYFEYNTIYLFSKKTHTSVPTNNNTDDVL